MSYIKSYKRLNTLIQSESFEPLISWGMRMGLAGTLPVVWGLYTSHIDEAVWIALASESVSWVEMKGAFTWRVRTLLAGSAFAILFSILGAVTGLNVWLSIAAMFVVGFFATLLKNIGDRASGLAICVYLMFIICNAYPEATYAGIKLRTELTAIGAVWAIFLGLAFSLFRPVEEPYRRQIALIWRAISELVDAMTSGYGSKNVAEARAAVYREEKDVRTAMDNSYQFFGRMVHQVNAKDDKQQYQLAMVRKAAGLVSVNIIAMGEELETLDFSNMDEMLRLKLYTLFNAMKEAVARISVFVITLKAEEKVLAISHISRMKNLAELIRQHTTADEKQNAAIARILKYMERTVKLLESAVQRIEQMGADIPVFRSYSLIKTSFLLKPKYLIRNIRGLFNFNTFTALYALRSALAATVAMFIYKWFNIDHGYWLPFSVMIIKQPYFGATLKKARERVAGTLLGVLAGSLLLHIPTGLYIKEIIVFITFVLMVYYVRRQYAVAAFIITINLVLLFNLELAYNGTVMLYRIMCTIGGGLLAVSSGFALPTWDKKWLPSHLAEAIGCNYEYFKATFLSDQRPTNWTRNKRSAESKNSNVFDSFNRYLEEPGREKSELYYDLATCNVRITRNLNNIHMEQDEKRASSLPATAPQQKKINECIEWFDKVMIQLSRLNPSLHPKVAMPDPYFSSPFILNDTQMLSLEKLIIELKTMHMGLEKLLQ